MSHKQKHLTMEKTNMPIIEKKKKNICRQCGDDWTPGHKCRNNQIIQCRIINGKEVQVSAPEISSDSNTDTKSE